jgi:uncharacterized protein
MNGVDDAAIRSRAALPRRLPAALIARSLAVAWVAVVSCSRPVPEPLPDITIRLGASSASGNFYTDGKAMSDVAQAALPHVHIELQTIGGGVRNLDMLQDGKTELAFSFSNVAYAAYSGESERATRPFKDLRGIAVLDLAPMHLLVGPHTSIHGMADLRGKNVDPGGPGSGAAQAFKVLSRAYGLAPTDVKVIVSGYEQGVAQLLDGHLDAMFVLGDYPSEPVMRAARAGAHLLPIVGPEADQLRADYQFFVPALIPQRGYPGVDATIRTVGVASVLLCRSDLDERLVHDLTAMIFNPQGNAASLAQTRHWSDVRQAAATPIPLHPGAARYYRERELSP